MRLLKQANAIKMTRLTEESKGKRNDVDARASKGRRNDVDDTVINYCHPMAIMARLRTAQKSDESQNQGKDTLMTVDLKDFYVNTPMDENEEEEKLDENGDCENCTIHGYENTVIIGNWGECFLNPQSHKYDKETVEKFYQNNTSFQCEA